MFLYFEERELVRDCISFSMNNVLFEMLALSKGVFVCRLFTESRWYYIYICLRHLKHQFHYIL